MVWVGHSTGFDPGCIEFNDDSVVNNFVYINGEFGSLFSCLIGFVGNLAYSQTFTGFDGWVLLKVFVM